MPFVGNEHWNIIIKIMRNAKRSAWRDIMRKLTLSEFISKAKLIHGEKYDYSKFVYVNRFIKGIIFCSESGHGQFMQHPGNHLSGKGCPKCGGSTKSTLGRFVASAMKIHGRRYDYSKFLYVNNSTVGIIICPRHGEFLQNPSNHLMGKNCGICAGVCKTISDFISAAKKIHDNRYDYSKFVYVTNQTKGIIICPEHGEFLQAPCNHTQGTGCPACNLSHGERKIMNFFVNKSILYEYNKTFDDCRNPITNRMLKFDFYLPHKRLLIEFDGRQHFDEVSTATFKRERLDDVQYRDSIKNEYAKTNRLDLLRIPYTELENVEEIILQKL